jgi:hypothetical protein
MLSRLAGHETLDPNPLGHWALYGAAHGAVRSLQEDERAQLLPWTSTLKQHDVCVHPVSITGRCFRFGPGTEQRKAISPFENGPSTPASASARLIRFGHDLRDRPIVRRRDGQVLCGGVSGRLHL